MVLIEVGEPVVKVDWSGHVFGDDQIDCAWVNEGSSARTMSVIPDFEVDDLVGEDDEGYAEADEEEA
jgi:hypothetical protein